MELFAGKKPLIISRVAMEWMKDFEKFLLGRVSNNTELTYLMTVNTVLNEAARRKIIPSNPWHDVPRHERLRRQDIFRTALTFEQLEMLAQTPCKFEDQFPQVYFFSCFTGLKWRAVNPLMWKEVIVRNTEGAERWFIYIEQEKTEGIEYLPLSPQAIEILKERKQNGKENQEDSIYVFPQVKETDEINRTVHKRITYSLKNWIKAAKKLWGNEFTITEEDMHFYNSRLTFATNMPETGAAGDIMLVSKLLGHKSLQCTQVYAHVREQGKLNAVDCFPKINLKSPVKNKAA